MSETLQFSFSRDRLDRVPERFEEFCVVRQSVRSGFPVDVAVRDAPERC